MTTVEELQKAWNARRLSAEKYLENHDNMERLKNLLLSALCDPAYSTANGTFDWVRFAREFTKEDFSPPLSATEFLDHMLFPHFAPPGFKGALSRSRIWWLVRLKLGVEDPVAYLEKQRSNRGAFAKIAKAIECPGAPISNVNISSFLVHIRLAHRPRLPKKFKKEGMSLLAIQDDLHFYAFIWGFKCRSTRKKQLRWEVVLREEIDPFPWSTKPIPFDRSPRAVMEKVLGKTRFRPEVILFYTGRPCILETGKVWWGYWPSKEELNGLTLDTTSGPLLVEDWDENGWPMGKKVSYG